MEERNQDYQEIDVNEHENRPLNSNEGILQTLQNSFDVEPMQILRRMVRAVDARKVMAFRSGANSSLLSNTNVDLYGPFWISATLVFLLSMVYSASDTDTKQKNPIRSLLISAVLFYLYTFLAPIITLVVTRIFLKRKSNESINLIKLIGLYGYSLSLLIPVTILILVPSSAFRWIVVTGEFLLTGFVLSIYVQCHIQPQEGSSIILWILIMAMHFLPRFISVFFFSP